MESGAEFANRPGFLRLMNALKPRAPFQLLIMSEVSRLGREQIETAWALKQLSTAGVRCFSYLDDKELLMESATDKFLLSAVIFAAEIEREKARQRVTDSMMRKARQGFVTGGRCYGFVNREIRDPAGRRSHVEREINETEATIVREMFAHCAAGEGLKTIAKALNARGVPPSQPRRGAILGGWAPSAIRSIFYRRTYLGEVRYGMTKKRDAWGQRRTKRRPAHEVIVVQQPAWRIISDSEWQAAHARLDAVRDFYFAGTRGNPFGRPALGDPAKYLLTNLAYCGCCGGALRARRRPEARHFYGCAGYHHRGRTICTNNRDVPMLLADAELVGALLEDVLDETIVSEAVDEAVLLLQSDAPADQIAAIECELETVNAERARLVAAIAAGGALDELLQAAPGTRSAAGDPREAERDRLRAERRLGAVQADQLRDELMALADSWRAVLLDDPLHARAIVSNLLIGRHHHADVDRRVDVDRRGHAGGIVRARAGERKSGQICVPVGLARPEGLEPPAYRFEACRSIQLSYGRDRLRL
jgi:DNA invertase Pin-like site-specific DNA recombinase